MDGGQRGAALDGARDRGGYDMVALGSHDGLGKGGVSPGGRAVRAQKRVQVLAAHESTWGWD